MTNQDIATRDNAALLEKVVIEGDLSKLSPAERMGYYNRVCESLGLNPLTRPFEYIRLSGKLTLYAKRDAADQLRKLHGISIDKPEITFEADQVIVVVTGHDKTGRSDADMGVVSTTGKKGDDLANCTLKAITKAKRRLTLSLVGLGWLDETEVETIKDAVVEHVDAETGVLAVPQEPSSPVAEPPATETPAQEFSVESQTFIDFCKENSFTAKQVTGWLGISAADWKASRIDKWLALHEGATAQDAIDRVQDRAHPEAEELPF